MQRLRIKFSRGEEVKFISHLDIMRLWQRIFIRAGVPLAYSAGFNPHPRISLAAPLALGVTSEAELMDVMLSKWSSPHAFSAAVSRQLPRGIEIDQVYNMPLTSPSLQSQVRFAEYRVIMETEKTRQDIEDRIASIMAKSQLPWQHQRDTGTRRYDLRALIDELRLIDQTEGCCSMGMRLRCDSNGSGRPEQVAAAMGFDNYPRSIHRTRLTLNPT
jgi:radical SAM-linked protein